MTLPLFTQKGKVFINEKPYDVERISSSIINIYSRKVNQGDPGPDDHPINSTWIQRSWDGGGQILESRPDVGNNRFYFSTMESMYANALTLAQSPTIYEDPGGLGRDSIVLGKFADEVYAAWGDSLYSFDLVNLEWDLEDTMASVAVAKGQLYTYSTGASIGQKAFYIPEGSGSEVWNGTALASVGKSSVSFTVWDDKLFRLGTDGSIEYTTDGTTWQGLIYIPDGSTPRKLLVYMNLGGDPAVHVVTSSSVYAYDFTTGRLYQTQMQYPNHPDQGRASSTWRAEMQVGVGLGVHRYNRSTIGAMGLDNNDGLPEAYRGVIVDLEPSYNALYALVSGATVSDTAPDAYTLNLGGGDDQMYGSSTEVTSLLMRWNGFGWHYVDSVTGTAPSTCYVSDAGNYYAVWYAAGGQIRCMELSRTYFNPKDGNNIYPTVRSGYLETMWYNYGWEGQTKIAKKFEIFVTGVSGGKGTVSIQYKLDSEDNQWTPLETVFEDGEHSYYLGRDFNIAETDNPLFYEGFPFERIKFRYIVLRDENDMMARPVIHWTDLVVRRFLKPNRNWRMVLDLTKKNSDYTPTELADNLIQRALATESTTFVHENEQYRVELVALEFNETAGATMIQYKATVNLIESNELDNTAFEAQSYPQIQLE